MRVVIVSNSGLGCLWAAVLAKNEQNKVVLIHHRTTFIEAIKRQHGILLKTTDSSENRQSELIQLDCFNSLEEGIIFHNYEVDAILFVVKSFHTSRVLKTLKKETIKKMNEFRTHVVCLQNSLSNVEELVKYFPKDLILFGTTVTHAVAQEGIVEGSYNRPTSLWCASNSLDAKAKKIVKNFTTSGLATTPTKDAEIMLWKKLAVNCAINSVTSLSLLKVRAACTESGGVGKDLMREIAAEVAKVAQTEGITLSEKEAIDSLDFVTRKAGNHVSTMCNDILNRRQTEIETMSGYVARCAEKHHLNVPLIRATRLLIKLIQDTYPLQLQPLQIKNFNR